MAVQEICMVVDNLEISTGLFCTTLEAPEIAALAQPGQFVHITCGEGSLLRRPISICTREKNRVQIVFQVKGEGTSWLAARRVGDVLDILGALGHGYDMTRLGARPAMIGGGIGVPPLLYAMQHAKQVGAQPLAILGFRQASAVILEDAFRAVGETVVCTDDGSYGAHGFVSDLLQEHKEVTSVCACGPKGMLRVLADMAEQASITCQVSMEERMGCGIGACLVCACALKEPTGEPRYGHVCKDGPVFDAKEVVW